MQKAAPSMRRGGRGGVGWGLGGGGAAYCTCARGHFLPSLSAVEMFLISSRVSTNRAAERHV